MDTVPTSAAMEEGVAATRARRGGAADRKGWSLHVRLTLLVAGTLLPMFLLLGILVYQSYERTRQAAADRALQTTRAAMASVERELENEIAALEVLALSPALRSGDFAAFAPEAARFLNRYSGGTAVSIGDATGQMQFSTNATANSTLPMRTTMEGFAAVFRGERAYVSDLFVGRLSRRPIVTIDVPVNHEGRIIYALTFNAPRATFYDILEKLTLPSGWVISIFDRKAQHVARIPSLGDDRITLAAPSIIPELAVGNNRIVETVTLEGTPVLTAFTRSEQFGWAVAMGMPLDALSAPTRQAIAAALVTGLVLMLVGLLFASRLAGQIIRGQAHRDLLANELNHRVKNTLTSVLGIVTRGLQGSAANETAKAAIEARLMALSHAHDILSTENWQDADLSELANAIIEPHLLESGRGWRSGGARLHGPPVRLKPRVAIALAMILNELVTNAVKHGALTKPTGAIDLSWRPVDGGRLHLEWRESGGPQIQAPEKSGYGMRFIERAVTNELNGTCAISYASTGLVCSIDISLENAVVWI